MVEAMRDARRRDDGLRLPAGRVHPSEVGEALMPGDRLDRQGRLAAQRLAEEQERRVWRRDHGIKDDDGPPLPVVHDLAPGRATVLKSPYLCVPPGSTFRYAAVGHYVAVSNGRGPTDEWFYFKPSEVHLERRARGVDVVRAPEVRWRRV